MMIVVMIQPTLSSALPDATRCMISQPQPAAMASTVVNASEERPVAQKMAAIRISAATAAATGF